MATKKEGKGDEATPPPRPQARVAISTGRAKRVPSPSGAPNAQQKPQADVESR